MPTGDGVRRAYAPRLLGDAANMDRLGSTQLVVLTTAKGPSAAAFLPQAGGKSLTFELREGKFVDKETGSLWNLAGHAVEGPLKGEKLTPVPSRFSFWFSIVGAYPDIEVFAP